MQSLEACERKKMDIKSQLNREKRFLLRKLNQLREQYPYNSHRIRSISESSSGFSSISTSPTYEGSFKKFFFKKYVHILFKI